MEQEWDFFTLLLMEGSTGAERKEFLGVEGRKEFAPEEMEHIQVCTYPSHIKTLLIESHFTCNQFGRDRRRSHEIGKGKKDSQDMNCITRLTFPPGHHPSNLFGGARRIRSGRGGLNQAIHILRGF